MSGHSKWHNIQAKKSKVDAKKGKIFTKIGKEIAIAAKDGSNPDTNSKLRDVISKAKANNMPQDTINRAIKKGAGEMEGMNYEEVTYEGYGPGGVAIIVKALTDNKNRTAGNVRTAFTRSGGNLGASGCVSWMFKTKGQIIIEKTDELDEDSLMMKALDAGAEDFNTEDEVYEITTTVEDFASVRDSLEKDGLKFVSADIVMTPDNILSVDMEMAEKVQKLIDKLEDNDDVQDVYHNADFPDEFEG
ncbi:YebC/PmpR family DNA-binding transcriptional regulator [Clostridium sp. cel8]|jgi:YebC/PmpR family DNA-binding regulatory protein|uniref:YebC/PmpR family DNA-binding transcriptional regulator n=1 Tax=unclassified Clostridium TaxID=2614128 RepID=UPI0015F53893|nr:YebC/PmpR family DNA-binding transcriptional regulator [Clostridium sp. cel8]MBA5850924.1 YebC/PmpR family DNA-binding transcriptional regulator [Clostridium sp. cel8]